MLGQCSSICSSFAILPFSMIVVGRYDLWPAICVYGANMVLLALTAIGVRTS